MSIGGYDIALIDNFVFHGGILVVLGEHCGAPWYNPASNSILEGLLGYTVLNYDFVHKYQMPFCQFQMQKHILLQKILKHNHR